VANDAVAAEDAGEQGTDALDALVVALSRRELSPGESVESGSLPHRGVHLDDERAARGVVRVSVDLHYTVGCLRDVELERVEDEVGAQPHELAPTRIECRPERLRILRPRRRVHSVRGHDELMRGRALAG